MMKKITLLILIFFLIANSNNFLAQGNSQTINSSINFLPVKPEAYSLLKFDINPVDLHTGIPDVSESLYILNVDPNIKIDLNLRYHPLGLRVKELSGIVGQGWNFFSPGSINREINGLNDDKPLYGILDNNFESNLLTNGWDNEVSRKFIYDSKMGLEDLEYDLFHFNFLNHSGSFKINKDGTGTYIGTKGFYKINFIRNANDSKRIQAFTITDDKGYKYQFNDKSFGSEVLSKIINYEGGHIPSLPPVSINVPSPYSTWYLNEIVNPQNITVASFEYAYTTEIQPYTESKITNIRLSNEYFEDNSYTDPETQITTTVICNHENLLPTTDVTIITNPTGKVLSKIIIPQKAIVDFSVNNHQLNSIDIRNNNNQIVKKISFNYTITNAQRRFLQSYQIKDSLLNTIQNYSFDYHNINSLPEVNSNSYDFWGFSNGQTNNNISIIGHTPILDNKKPDKERVKDGVLTKIHLPTGGYKEFEFESNTYSKELINPNLIFDIEENRQPTFKNKNFTVFNNNNIPSDYIIYIKEFQKINVQLAATQYTSNPVNGINDIKANAFILTPVIPNNPNPPDPDMVLVSDTFEENASNTLLPRSKISISLTSGTSETKDFYGKGYYKVSVIPNIDGQLQYNLVKYSLNIYYYNLLINFPYLYGGGLRIKKITVNDGVNNYSKRFDYSSEPSGSNPLSLNPGSSGEIINLPLFSYVRNYNWSQQTGSNFIGPIIQERQVHYLTVNEPQGFTSVSQIKGSFVNYKNVKAIDNKGTQKNIFSVYSDDPTISFTSIYYPTFRAVDLDYKVGLLEKSYTYNQNNTILNTIENTYNILNQSKSLGYSAFEHNGGCYLQNGPYSSRVKNYDNFKNQQNTQPYPSSLCGSHFGSFIGILNSVKNFGSAEIEKSIQKDFFNQDSITVETRYSYNVRNYPTEKKTIFPGGEVDVTTYTYAHEKGNLYLIDKNMIGIPLETITTKKKNAGDTGKVISHVKTEYPTSQAEADTKTFGLPLPYEVLSKDLQNTNMTKEVTYTKYDPANGNLQEYKIKDQIPVAIIWGYNSTQPIAKIEGATYADVQNFAAAIITASNADAGAVINNDESSLLTALDTFRRNPALANFQVTTYTYDPLIGVRSITPPSGIREYYIYDTANRLEKIVDINGKILKEFKYNYKQ